MCRPRLHGLIRSNFRLGVRGKRFVIGVDGRNGPFVVFFQGKPLISVFIGPRNCEPS